MCSLLLRFLPDAVEFQDIKKNTPLHIACDGGNMTSANTILRSTLNPPSTLFKLTNSGTLYTVSIKRELDVSLRNEEDLTSEHLAGSHGFYELAALIQYELHKSGKAWSTSAPLSKLSLIL